MTDSWDSTPEVEVFENEIEGSDTFIRVNNANIDIEPGSNFKTVVKSNAKDASLGKFRVFLNGAEILPSDSPELVSEGDSIELRPYDVAGCEFK